jgi:3-oxoacyl-[acyl-carrier-protein] synthase II
MKMSIEGFSCLGAFGNGGDCLAEAISTGHTDTFKERTDTSGLTNFFPPRVLRQCDHFSRLAILGACLAAQNAGLNPTELGNCGIVLATGYGPATPTFDFLDSLLDYGEQMASPLAFSLSVHNIPAAIVAKTLQIQGPCATVCQYESSVASGLLLASQWLDDKRIDRVLFGAVDEYTDLLNAVTLRVVKERERQGARQSRRALPLAEGAAFFILSRPKDASLGDISSVSLTKNPDHPTYNAPSSDCLYFFSGAVSPEAHDLPGVLDGSPAYGNIPVATALDLAAAVTMLSIGGAAFSRCCCRNYTSNVQSEIILKRARP